MVTGGSSGIGRAIAEVLAEAGHLVFATSRDPSRVKAPPGVSMLPLDVRSDESARECVDGVFAAASRIDVLVNNAGYTLAGAIEEATLAEAQSLFETNVFGVVRMTRLALPVMRRQRSGHIVNISSGLARVRPPYIGFYAASKCAVEGYSEALWHELRPLGIHVSVVAPGYVATNIESAAARGSERIDAYEPWRGRALGVIHRRLAAGRDPRHVAERVGFLVASGAPAFYVPVGWDARTLSALRRVLPQAAYRRVVRTLFRVGSGAPPPRALRS